MCYHKFSDTPLYLDARIPDQELRMSSSILSIIPLVPISPGRSAIFSYLPGKNALPIPRGSVVSIPFGAQTTRGIVWSEGMANADPPKHFHYKAIHAVLAPKFLGERELEFAERLARESRIGLGTTLERFVPAIPISTTKKHVSAESPLPKSAAKKYRLTSEQKTLAKKLSDSNRRSILLFHPNSPEPTTVCFELIRTLLNSGGQALLIVSDRAILSQEEARYTNIFGKKSVLVSDAALKDSEKSKQRDRIRSGSARIIIGTAASIFLAFRNLRLILLKNADAPTFDSIGTPFTISVAEAARYLAEIHSAIVVRMTSTPSFESFFRAQEKQSIISLPDPPKKDSDVFRIVNLRLEQWKKKLSPITDELRLEIASTLKKKRQSILFVSRSGMSAFSVCDRCKNVLRCSACHRSISYEKSGEYSCKGCGWKWGSTPQCSTCGSILFKHIGIGTDRVERDIKRKFPDARLVRYDEKNRKLSRTKNELEAFGNGERDILITTEKGVRGWDLPRLSLVAIMDADTLLGISRWDADERALRTFLAVTEHVEAPKEPSKTILIQTFHPENPLFSILKERDLLKFFETIKEEREYLLYPPFGYIRRLTCRLPSEKKLAAEVAEKLRHLEETRKTANGKTSISVSETIRKPKERRYEQAITLREASTSGNETRSIFHHTLDSLPSCWIIEENTL